jgi:DNA polymerase-1
VSVEQVPSECRQLAKAVNFGLLYGLGARTFQTYARQHYHVSLTPAEAEQCRQRFFVTYAGLRRGHRETGATQPTETRTLAERKRQDVSRFTERLSSPVQGTGADGLKWALARLFDHRDDAPDARLVAVVHNEIVAACPVKVAAQTAAWLR